MSYRGGWLLFLVLLSGCGTVTQKVSSFMGGEDNAAPPTPLEDITPLFEVNPLWDREIGDGTNKQYLKLAPVYDQGRIHVVDSDGLVESLDAQTGSVLWKTDVDKHITGGPGAGENLVSVGTGKAEVIVLSANSGEILWHSKVSSEVLSPPQHSGNLIVARTIDGNIFGLNSADGKRVWAYNQTVPALTLRGTSAPVISGNYLVAGFDEGRLAALELQTGKLVWDTRIVLGSGRTELERMIDIDAEPVIVDGVIYVVTFQGRIAAIELESGHLQWSREISSFAGLSADTRAIYITDDDSVIWALDRATGESLWKQDRLRARAVTAPALTSDMIVVGDVEGYVHWLDKATGALMARERVTKHKIISAPIAVEDTVIVYDTDGTLAAYTTHPAPPAGEK